MKLVKDKIFSLEVDDMGWTREDVINAQLEDQIFAEGVKQGKAEGIEQGIERGKKETALAMLKEKISLEKIAKCTRISIEELKKLNEEIKNIQE